MVEEDYYTALAEYQLLIEGIVDPSLEQLRKTKAYLSHIFVRHSAFILGSFLTDRDIEILHKLSCGERAIDIAVSFGVSRTRIAQLLNSIFKNFGLIMIQKQFTLQCVWVIYHLGEEHYRKFLKLWR